ncbi:MAG: purine-binding chemotaxis protein CheW [Ignavibacteria bacterium]|jgi:purine-binding chemotaxis protein CheW|nr:purine-binding chemotaxis protein CheW [Ignavibacteria bacterium]MCU7501765.1 purine-binding chemotaxis protein CheW [Ignavibacteria bacterium]MCU7516828.1 purine-binding chemotaxis protein CheW [Ignavibacteria bacterium]
MLDKKGNLKLSHEQLGAVMKKLRALSESALEAGDPEKEAILRKRAEKLAEKVSRNEAKEETEVIEFGLASERFAIETLYLKEVIHVKEITPVPLTPPFVKGIVNLRGNIISVLDIKVFFELPNDPNPGFKWVIILQDNEMTFGILADEIAGIKKLSLRNSIKILSDLNAIRQKYLKAVTSGRVAILDGSKLLNDSSLIINDKT